MKNYKTNTPDVTEETFSFVFDRNRMRLPLNLTLHDVGNLLASDETTTLEWVEASRILVATLESTNRFEQVDALTYLLKAKGMKRLNEYFHWKVDEFLANRKNSEVIAMAKEKLVPASH